MHSRNLCCLIAAWYLMPAVLFTQGLSVQLKVRDSRLFGLSGERYGKLEFSSQNQTLPLTSVKVNSGRFFYFVFRPVGNWVIDADFATEETPKLTLQQNSQVLRIGWKGEVASDAAGSLLLIGFSKDLKLHEPFLAQFHMADSTTQGTFVIPQEYWPGYPVFMDAVESIERAIGEKRYRDGIALCEQALRTEALQIFPQFSRFRDSRINIFERLHNQAFSFLAKVSITDQVGLKERIAQIDEVKRTFQYILDSLTSSVTTVADTDSSVKRLLDHATFAMARSSALRDSLQLTLDDQNVRWMIEGRPTGKVRVRYQSMIETLVYAFSSVDFADTTSASLSKLVIPPEMKQRLTKSDLEECYVTFVRQCSDRLQRQGSLFPPEFLENLRKDTTSFSLPFYSMLRAINDFYAGDVASVRNEITTIFRTCSEPELSARFDQLRVSLDLRQHRIPSEVMKMLHEAVAAEGAGNNESALEGYREVHRIVPDFAYASYRLGKFFERTGDPNRAQTFLEQAYQADTLYLSAYREVYTLYYKRGNFKTMIEVLMLALKHGNDFWEINVNLGHAYNGNGDLANAIRCFERALVLNSRNYKTNVWLGSAYQETKNFQKARQYFNRAIEIDSELTEAVELKAKLDEFQKNER